MGINASIVDAKKAVEPMILDAKISKEDYMQPCNSEKKKKSINGMVMIPNPNPKATPSTLAVAKAHYEKSLKALKATKLAAIIE